VTVRAGLSVVEYTDPACRWSWGLEPVVRWLRLAFDQAQWRRVFGIVFDDDDDPAPDLHLETAWFARIVAATAAHTGAPYPDAMQWMPATSWPASLVAKAAESQGPAVASQVLRRLRETTFVYGTPADTIESALNACVGIAGLDAAGLDAQSRSDRVRDAVRADYRETRAPLDEVIGVAGDGPHPGAAKELDDGVRYALPTLVFEGAGGRIVVPGWRPLREYLNAARTAAPGIATRDPHLGPTAALDRFRSLTCRELELFTGAPIPPRTAVHLPTSNGGLWLHPEEAASRLI
jgi:predicted DsbA family dithiol-disulfide isomerase